MRLLVRSLARGRKVSVCLGIGLLRIILLSFFPGSRSASGAAVVASRGDNGGTWVLYTPRYRPLPRFAIATIAMAHLKGFYTTEDPDCVPTGVPTGVREPSSPPDNETYRPPTRDREPSLPPLPAVSWDAQTQSFAKRKRSTASQIFSDSSDPAVFSSDDDPALDNYVEGRHKKRRYVGSWFQQHPAPGSPDSGMSHRPASRGKREFVPVDSGVFMGSDASMDDTLDELPPPQANKTIFPPARARPKRIPNPTPTPTPPQLSQVPRGSQTSKLPEAEDKAQALIRRCIDDGDERVDLS